MLCVGLTQNDRRRDGAMLLPKSPTNLNLSESPPRRDPSAAQKGPRSAGGICRAGPKVTPSLSIGNEESVLLAPKCSVTLWRHRAGNTVVT
jgi:hypothetical protein